MAVENKELMTEGSVQKKIIMFALPLMFGNLFQQLYNAADSMIVGNFIGSNALAAVTSAGNLIFLVVGFFSGISVGAGVVIARFIGAGDDKNTATAVHTTVALGILCSIFMTVVGVVFAKPVLILMSTPRDVLSSSVIYFRIYFAGSAGFVMYNMLMGIMQAAGDSRHPLQYLVISSLINIVLDLLLIGVFGFGVGAAAFATVVSQVASAILCFVRLTRVDASYRVKISQIGFERKTLRKIIHYGVPSGLQNSILAFSNVVIQSYINSFGMHAVAGIGAYTKIEGFAFLPTTSFSMALTTFISQNIGAGEKKRAQKGARFGIICAITVSEIIGLTLMLFAAQLIALFDSNPEVIFYGVQRARICAPFFLLVTYTHIMAAILRGSGKAVSSMYVFLFCWCVVRVAFLAVMMPFFHSIYLTYWVYPMTWTISSVVMTILYKKLDFSRA